MSLTHRSRFAFGLISGALVLTANPASAQDLREVIGVAMQFNPEINQAVQNKEAIEFERRQAQGLYLPRISVETSAGLRRLENPSRRALNLSDERLEPVEGSLISEYTLFDSGARRSELKRQASRVAGAAARVEERSEFIAANIARLYLDFLLQERLVAAAADNIQFHEQLVADLSEAVRSGSISIADQQQAQERLQAARARRIEAQESLEGAAISLRRLSGIDVDKATMPPVLTGYLPTSMDEAIGQARRNNPRVQEALADIDAAHAVVSAARAEQGPRISLEGRGRTGYDVDGFRGRTNDVQGRVIFRMDLFDGGIKAANVQEQIRRASEARYRLHEMERQAEEDVRSAWSRLVSQQSLVTELVQQSRASDDLLLSYREQFNIGRRSLLDVLDVQNTRYNVQVQVETARFAQLYAEYRLLAATNQLLEALEVQPQSAARSDARDRFKVGPTPPAELQPRQLPD